MYHHMCGGRHLDAYLAAGYPFSGSRLIQVDMDGAFRAIYPWDTAGARHLSHTVFPYRQQDSYMSVDGRFPHPCLFLYLPDLSPLNIYMTSVCLRSSEGGERTVIAATFRQLWNLLFGQGTLELPDGTLIADSQYALAEAQVFIWRPAARGESAVY